MIKIQNWQAYHTPPRAGGLDDQIAGWMRRANYLQSVYALIDNFYHGDGSLLKGKANSAIFNHAIKLYKDSLRNGRN